MQTEALSMQKRSWLRLRKDWAAMFGLAVILCCVLVSLLAPKIVPYDPTQTDLKHRRESPSAQHLLGTDEMGRDELSRLIVGSRTTITTGLVAVAIGGLLGVGLGLIAGYAGGWTDWLIMRFIDYLLAFPYFLLAIAIVAVLGKGLMNAIIAVAITTIPQYARVVRGSVLSVRNSDFVEAARACGQRDLMIVVRHILPNIMAPIIVLATVGMGSAILSASALSFLGLGAQPPTVEWGSMLNGGKSFITDAPHIAIFPGLAIMLVATAFNLLGDGVRDALDPKLKL